MWQNVIVHVIISKSNFSLPSPGVRKAAPGHVTTLMRDNLSAHYISAVNKCSDYITINTSNNLICTGCLGAVNFGSQFAPTVNFGN